jgi:hypothetical protein
MKASPPFTKIGRYVVVIFLAVLAVWGSNAPTLSFAAQERSIPVMIQTVPEMPDARFSLSGKVFRADNHGLALTTVPRPGTYRLRLLSSSVVKGDSRLRFSRWSDNETRVTRPIRVASFTLLHAGFEATTEVSPLFVDAAGETIDPDHIESVTITDNGGSASTLRGPAPYPLVATTIRQDRASLVLEEVTYTVTRVVVDGEEVLMARVKLRPAAESRPTVELRLAEAPPAGGDPESSAQEDAPPFSREDESAFPLLLLIVVLLAMVLGAAMIAADRLHIAAATRNLVMRVRSWSPAAGLRRINPFPRIAAGLRNMNPGPAIARGLRRMNPGPAIASGVRKINPGPAIAAGLRRINPGPAIAAWFRGLSPRHGLRKLRRLNPVPKLAAGVRGLRPAGRLSNLRRLSPGSTVTSKIHKRRLKAQLKELRRQEARPKAKAPEERRKKPLPVGKKGGGISLLWLRGSRSRGSMREYGRGPKVRIKLKNGHVVIGTIRRTPTHADQSALNIFVERTYDSLGNEVPNLPEDSFILPSQILSIERLNDDDHKIIRLPEPQDHGAGGRRGLGPRGDQKKADGP